MTETYSKSIALADITPTHLKHLTRACKVGYHGYKGKDMLQQIAEGHCQLWEIDWKDSSGIFIVKVQDHPTCREYEIECLAGDNLVTYIRKFRKEFREQMREEARQRKCTHLTFNVVDERLQYLYTRVFRPTQKTIRLSTEI